MHKAAANGHLEVCKLLIDNVDDKNPADDYGLTPWHKAAANGHLEVCKLLIDNVADKNPVDKAGETPIHLGVEKGHLEVCRLMIGAWRTKIKKSRKNELGV